jgi:L-ascorbate metabolism protein UlaG (beta-lactamase superfamily)
MNVSYIHHSGFLVETGRFYHLFDYESGSLPELDPQKPIYVYSSHSHGDHYTPEIFPLLRRMGMEDVRAVLSDDIDGPAGCVSVGPGKCYDLDQGLTVTAFASTDLGVAFLVEDHGMLIYHAGDLNDWVWDEEPEEYNRQMTIDYRKQIELLARTLAGREIDAAFVVLDPRQEQDYDRGMCWFLEHIAAKKVYPMHYWDDPSVIVRFLKDYPQYVSRIQRTE